MTIDDKLDTTISQMAVALDLDKDREARLRSNILLVAKAANDTSGIGFHGAERLLSMLVQAYMEQRRDDGQEEKQ